MSTKKILPFEIDAKSKTFRFNTKNYQELFKENSEVNAAFKAAMALGCYDGYVPVVVRKNYFLYENPEARIFCGMAADRKYELKPLGHFLKQAVDARIKQLKAKGEWEQEKPEE